MFEWPAKCGYCGRDIGGWSETGLFDGEWVHKLCWSDMYRDAQAKGVDVEALRSPVDRSSQLELPMAISMLMFHFGLAAAVAGWFLLTQTAESRTVGIALLVAGLVVPLTGAMGAAVNVVSRRRIELIRHELDLQGGWKPGR